MAGLVTWELAGSCTTRSEVDVVKSEKEDLTCEQFMPDAGSLFNICY